MERRADVTASISVFLKTNRNTSSVVACLEPELSDLYKAVVKTVL